MSSSWSTVQVQGLTVPCYSLGAISYLTFATLSDRIQKRALFSLIGCCLSTVGYAILLSHSVLAVHYFACFIVAAGLYSLSITAETWVPLNQPKYGKRTTAVGMQLTFANSAGAVSPFVSTLDRLNLNPLYSETSKLSHRSSFIRLPTAQGIVLGMLSPWL